MSSLVMSNFDELWGEIEIFWETLMQNEFYVGSSNDGYLWVDLLNIAEEYNVM